MVKKSGGRGGHTVIIVMVLHYLWWGLVIKKAAEGGGCTVVVVVARRYLWWGVGISKKKESGEGGDVPSPSAPSSWW